jgi:hypothetical protein
MEGFWLCDNFLIMAGSDALSEGALGRICRNSLPDFG